MAKSLFRIGGYFVATSSQAAISFIAVPLLIHALGVAEFGRWGIIEPIIQVAAQIGLFGINQGIIKLVNQDGYNPSRAFFLLLKPAIPILSCVCLATSLIAATIGFSVTNSVFLGLLVAAESLLMLALAGMRAGNLVTGFVSASLLKSMGVLAILLCNRQFSLPLITSAEQVVMWWSSISVSSLCVAVISLSFLTRKTETRICLPQDYWSLYRDSVRYGLPMLVSSLLMLAVLNLDRFFLQHYLDYRQVGEYVVYVKIANALNFLVMPVQLWWPTARFRNIESEDGGARFFSFTALILCHFILMGAMGLWMLSPWLYDVFNPSGGYDKWIALFPIFGMFFYAMATPLNVGLLKAGNTHFNMLAVGVAAALSAVLCFFLVPEYGVYGAAASALMGNLIMMVMLNVLSQKLHFIPFNYLRLTAFFVLFVSFSVVLVYAFDSESVFSRIAVYSLVCAAFIFLNYRMQFAKLWQVLRGRFG